LHFKSRVIEQTLNYIAKSYYCTDKFYPYKKIAHHGIIPDESALTCKQQLQTAEISNMYVELCNSKYHSSDSQEKMLSNFIIFKPNAQ